VPATGIPARFDDESFQIGRVQLADKTMLCVFNWTDAAQTVSVSLPKKVQVKDYWTGQDLGAQQGALELKNMPPHSGRLFACIP
jgi:alpha-galactosidase